jgi:hypothetical protein
MPDIIIDIDNDTDYNDDTDYERDILDSEGY